MLNNIRADLRRYVKRRRDCPSNIFYLLQFIPIILLHEGAISMIGYRLASWLSNHRLSFLGYLVSKVFLFLTGNYIYHNTIIAPGCKINHSAVVIHAGRIGKAFECSANVTIGQKVPYRSPFPNIGDFVMVGAGARVLSDLGNEVIVGANAAVIEPVEDGQIVGGIPAVPIKSSKEKIDYYKTMIP